MCNYEMRRREELRKAYTKLEELLKRYGERYEHNKEVEAIRQKKKERRLRRKARGPRK